LLAPLFRPAMLAFDRVGLVLRKRLFRRDPLVFVLGVGEALARREWRLARSSG
jgi:hypothetical protein